MVEALLSERRLLMHVLDALEEGLIVHDHERHIFLFNRAAEAITGYPREEVLGRNCHEIFAPDGICSSQCPFKAGEEGSLRRDDVVAFSARSGEDRRLRLSMAPLPGEPGRPPAVLAIMRDVTEVMELRFRLSEKYSFHGMVGRSAAMREIFQTIRQVTTSEYPVLITGESGTGKELVARAIHQESRRKGGPFVPINCGALPETILESELFGHVRGAFTGAVRDKKGRFELASGGTLFLDEVGDLSPAFQVKLLRVLQEKRFEPVGGEEERTADVRVIAATNRDLAALVRDGKFREDLFYRLAVVPIHLPPLRERREDVPMLVEQILGEIRKESGKESLRLSDRALEALLGYPWPGNVRELINALQYASIRAAQGPILPEHLPLMMLQRADASAGRSRLSRARVEEALRQSGGNRKRAARLLGVGRATLYRFLGRTGEKKKQARRRERE
ncbi:MAG: sigma 54-interacting transcriptional regulator [Myxococcales bacterium]|nr:sigma 54-interacting transcriptional regulator [Myxococcales bacterium]